MGFSAPVQVDLHSFQSQFSLPISHGGFDIPSFANHRCINYYVSCAHALAQWRIWLSLAHPMVDSYNYPEKRCTVALTRALNDCRCLVDSAKGIWTPELQSNPEKHLQPLSPIVLPDRLQDITLVNPESLHESLSRHLHRVIYSRMWSAAHGKNLILLQIQDNTTNTSSLFLQAIPTHSELTLANDVFAFALRTYSCFPTDSLFGLPVGRTLPCTCVFPSPILSERHLINCTGEASFSSRVLKLHEDVFAMISSVGPTSSRPNPDTSCIGFQLPSPYPHSTQTKAYCAKIMVVSHAPPQLDDMTKSVALQMATRAIDAMPRSHDADRYTAFFHLVAQFNGAMTQGFYELLKAVGALALDRPPFHSSWASPSFASYWMQVFNCTLWRETYAAQARIARKAARMDPHNPTELCPSHQSDPEDADL